MNAHSSVVSHRNFTAIPAAAAPTIDMMGLSRMLGIDKESATSRRHTSPKTRITYVQMLIDSMGFPPPLPHMVMIKGELGERGHQFVNEISYSKSRWQRAAVDAWFDGILPPHIQPAIDDQAARAAASRLDQAAEALAS